MNSVVEAGYIFNGLLNHHCFHYNYMHLHIKDWNSAKLYAIKYNFPIIGQVLKLYGRDLMNEED